MVDNSQTFITDTVKYRYESDARLPHIRQAYKKYITLISEVRQVRLTRYFAQQAVQHYSSKLQTWLQTWLSTSVSVSKARRKQVESMSKASRKPAANLLKTQ